MDPRAEHNSLTSGLADAYPVLGLARSWHRSQRGQPMDFTTQPFLVPLYANIEALETASFCKGVQTGITEMFIVYMLHAAGWRGKITAYITAQDSARNRLVSNRIDPILEDVPAYAKRTPGGQEAKSKSGSDNLAQKKFGAGTMFFFGSGTRSNFVELSCDIAIVDEYDLCNGDNIVMVPDRIKVSTCGQLFYIGNPEVASDGIHKRWLDGSQARWLHRCACCGFRQPLDWEINIVMRADDGRWVPRDQARANDASSGDIRPVCRHCNQPWELGTSTGNIWHATEPTKAPSFHIAGLDVLNRRGEQTMRAAYAEFVSAQGSMLKLTAFYRARLGWPYELGAQRITTAMIEAATDKDREQDLNGYAPDYEVKDTDPTRIMGVDVGSLLNFTISNVGTTDGSDYVRSAIRVGTVKDFDDLLDYVIRYKVNVCAIDANPETRKAKEFMQAAKAYGCSVWLVDYAGAAKVGRDEISMRPRYDEHKVSCDRTQLLDATLDEVAAGKRRFPADIMAVTDFAEQMRAPVRKLNDTGDRMIWDEGANPDHYRHADAYERIALEMHKRGGRTL